MGSFFVTHATNLLYRTQLTDAPTCYKAFGLILEVPSSPLRWIQFCSSHGLEQRGASIIEADSVPKASVAEGKKSGGRLS